MQVIADALTLEIRISGSRCPEFQLAPDENGGAQRRIAMGVDPRTGRARPPPTLFAQQIDRKRRVDVNHSFGMRGRSLRRNLICRSTASRVSSLMFARCAARSRSAPVPPLNCRLITSENDSPGPLRRANAS